jgi:hypothetical protein
MTAFWRVLRRIAAWRCDAAYKRAGRWDNIAGYLAACQRKARRK